MDADKIIVNSEILFPTHVPEKPLHREKERLQLKNNLTNLIHTVVLGSFGSGKTALAKTVVKEFNASKNGYAAYIDCAVYQTTYSILKEILPKSELVFYRSNYELIRELRKYIKDNKVSIILDNFDQLKDRNLISRLMSLGICVVLLADSEENFDELDVRIRSSIPSMIRLSDYTSEQAFDIIRSRAEKALTKYSYSDTVLKKIAESIHGNITLGLNVLKAEALKAENEGKKTVEESDIQIEGDCPGPNLTRDEKIIFEIMQQWKSLPSSRLYTFYVERSRHPKGERAFRNYMHSLCSKGLVEAVGDKRGRIYEFKDDENVQNNGKVQQDRG